MDANERVANIRLSDHEQPGLYLTLKDSIKLSLTREHIEKVTYEYWLDPDKIPPSVKEAVEFQRCPFCPLKNKKDFCDALRPILPLLDVMDNYYSYDEVIAVYKGEDKELCHLSFATMQRVLRYISTLSLIEYCQVGKKYRQYFHAARKLILVREHVSDNPTGEQCCIKYEPMCISELKSGLNKTEFQNQQSILNMP